MGRRKSGRDVSGVILLDKPRDISSNAALQQVRRFLNANKAGHTGALDPAATGLLPLCFGEATKVSHYSLEADKAYRVEACLGIRTTTSDSEGEIVAQADAALLERLTQADIDRVIKQFTGPQQQSPSMYSALKHEGRPLYYYARLGIEVPRKTRAITIREINLVEWHGARLVLDVTCSKGTYIRTLIDDMGAALGCGAHVAELHRSWIEGVVGPVYSAEELAAVAAQTDPEQGDYAAIDALLLANDTVIQHLPTVTVEAAEAGKFLLGNPAQLTQPPEVVADHYRVLRSSDGVFIGMGLLQAPALATGPAEAGLWVKPKRVLNLRD